MKSRDVILSDQFGQIELSYPERAADEATPVVTLLPSYGLVIH